MNFIFTKVKIVAITLFAALLPVLYLFGRKDGKAVEQTKKMEDALETNEKVAEFYKEIEHTNNEIEAIKPRNTSTLIKRLRDRGL